MYGEMQQLVRNDGGNIIPLFPNIVDAGSKKLGYEKIASNAELDGGRAAERMWFKS
jgi:peptide/nickel transport system substrate-binding protein